MVITTLLIFVSPCDICAAFPGILNDPNPCVVFVGVTVGVLVNVGVTVGVGVTLFVGVFVGVFAGMLIVNGTV